MDARCWSEPRSSTSAGSPTAPSAPDRRGAFPAPDVVEADFAAMAAAGINAVRTYTVPPRLAARRGAASTACASWSGCPGSSTSRSSTTAARAPAIAARVRDAVARAAPGTRRMLCYVVGNEIPAPIVRWHGARRGRALPRAAAATRQGRGPRRARHLRQLPHDRVPRAAVPRPRLRSTSTSSDAASVRGLPGAAAEPRRRPAAADHRARARQPAQRRSSRRRGRSAGRSRRAFAAGCRRRVRLLLDRRVAPRRRTTCSTGTSASSTATRGRSRRWRRCAALRAAPFAPPAPWPPVSVVVCTLQRRRARSTSACAAVDDARLPRLRGDRRRRRLDRRHAPRSPRRHGVRADPTENRGLSARAQQRRSRRRRGEIVAYLDDDA